MIRTARVPEELRDLFERAEEVVSRYWSQKREFPERGRIEIRDQRYILVRAPSLSVEFYDLMESLYGERTDQARATARNLLFHLGHFLGRSDASTFHRELGLHDPIARLSAGPIHFAHTGWAFVDIHAGSRPVPNDDYLLVYDHPYSFESDSWQRAGRVAPGPVCFMNAGYSAGWCEESFGIPLVATEILCTAAGAPCCRFVMGPPSRIESLVKAYLAEHPEVAEQVTTYEVPGEFEHRELERSLQVSESRYRQLFEESADALLTLEAGRVDHVNRRATQLLGMAKADIRGLGLEAFVPEAQPDGTRSRDLLRERSERALAGEPQQFPLRMIGAKGSPIEAEVSLTAITGAEASVLVIIRDLTERERLADEVRQLQKMEALGTFAGGVAHDFNNLLTSAAGSLAQVRKEIPSASSALGWLDETRSALDRAASVVRQLLTLSTTSQRPWQTLSARDVVDRGVSLIRASLDPRVELEVGHADEDLRVEGDEAYLCQSVAELARNAAAAVLKRLERGEAGYRGRVAVRTRIVPNPGKRELSEVGTGPYVRIEVADNGVGMDEQTLRRCFEPFQTSKPAELGAGLGLTTVFGVMRQHHGWVDIESEEGKGTQAFLFLPLRGSGPDSRPPRAAPPEVDGPKGGPETVLFCDDEPSLRKLVSFVFERLNYRVLLAADGEEALKLLDASGGTIDIAILDATMPRLSGKDTLKALLARWADLPVILSSGYSTELDASRLLASGAAAFVPKPYDIDELARMVREILDERGRRTP